MKNNENKEKIFDEFYKYIGIHHAEKTAKKADEIIEKSKDVDFPKDLDLWFNEYIGDSIKEERKKSLNSKVSSIAKRVAIFLIILALGAFVTTISVEAYRVRLFNLITNITEKYTNINIERGTNEDTSDNNVVGKSHLYPEYIPIGYKQSDIQNYGELWLIHFENDNGDIIEFLQTKLDSNFQVDTEDATTIEVNISGSKGMLVSKEDVKTLFWFTDANNFYITGKLNQKEMVSMAESLEFIK